MLNKNFRGSNLTANASSTNTINKMTTCSHCGPAPQPIKIQNIKLWDESKKNFFENSASETPPLGPSSDVEQDVSKVREVLDRTLFFSEVEKICKKPNRTRRSLPRRAEVTPTPKSPSVTTPILLSKFDGHKIEIIPLEIDASDSNQMTEAIMRDRARDEPPRLERVAQIVTNIVHSPRALSYGRVTYPYDSSLTSTRQSSQPYGVPHSKLVIRPTRYRSQYRFPPDSNFYSGSPYSSDYYAGANGPQRPRKAKKLPAKLVDVHDTHDAQYEYIEMDVNHEGKQVPKKPPKYMRGRYKGHNRGASYGGYNDYYKKPTSRPYKKTASKTYYAPKNTYTYNEEHDRGEGFDYHDAFDNKRSPDYEESNEGANLNSQENHDDKASGEVTNVPDDSPPKKSKFQPSQPYPSGHYYQPQPQPQPQVESPVRPPHKFIPVPKTLEEYHQLHGTKFLNSYRPEEDDEFTFHPNNNPDEGNYDEEESATPSFNPPKQYQEHRRPAYQESRRPEFPDYSKPSYGGYDTKTPTSFMSVTYGKPSSDFDTDQTRTRQTSPYRKSKYSQPLPSAEPFESGSSNDELSSKELQTFLDQVKSHVYDEDGRLKTEFKSDLSSDLKSSHLHASSPYSSSRGRKKLNKGYGSNTKDLLENARGNYNKKHNYRNKNSYFASGNANSNFNHRNTYSDKKNGWKGAGDSGVGYKEINHQDSFDGDHFGKDNGVPVGFKRDLFGKDRMKSLIPSESNQQVSGRENPGRKSRRVKIRVTKTNQILEENETLVKPIIASGDRATTETSVTNATVASTYASNANNATTK